MQSTERATQPDSTYMDDQKEIREETRSILVDWLISVHIRCKLWPETLYITVNLIDRYLSLFQVNES